MNIPNQITIVRIIFVPIILILMLLSLPIENYFYFKLAINVTNTIKINIFWIIAGIIFIIAAISDWFDGYWARKKQIVTDFGKVFDPIADKMLVNGVLILMTIPQIIPVWLTVILILRDILIDGCRIFLSTKKIIVPANIWGKLKTILMLSGLSLLFFVNHLWFSFSNAWDSWRYHLVLLPVYLALVLSLYSGMTYIQIFKKFLNNRGGKKIARFN